MDSVLTAVLGAAPQAGGATLLIVVLVLVIRREGQSAERFAAELARVNAAHDAELAELREEIKGLRAEVRELNTALDAEREVRRAAQDAAGLPRAMGDEQWRR